jgi:hypothetical protein
VAPRALMSFLQHVTCHTFCCITDHNQHTQFSYIQRMYMVPFYSDTGCEAGCVHQVGARGQVPADHRGA